MLNRETGGDVGDYNDQNLQHVPCVIAKYRLTDEEWDSTPKRLQSELLRECAESDNRVSSHDELIGLLREVLDKWTPETGRQLERLLGTHFVNRINAALQEAEG